MGRSGRSEPQLQLNGSIKSKPLRLKSHAKWYLLGISFLIILCLITSYFLLINVNNDEAIRTPLLFLKNGEISFTYINPLKPVALTDSTQNISGISASEPFAAFFHYSNDCRYLFYPDEVAGDSCSYFVRDFSKKIGNPDAIMKIDSNVVDIGKTQLTDDGSKFIYLKGTDRRLYLFNGNDKTKIGNNVESFYIDKTGDYIVYITDDGALYEMDLKSGSDKVEIDINTNLRLLNMDTGNIIYLKNKDLYYKEHGKDTRKIASDVSSVYSFDNTNGIYYSKINTTTSSLSDYVIDNMAAIDSAQKEPVQPNLKDYQYQEWVSTYTNLQEWLQNTGYWVTKTNYAAYNAAMDKFNNDTLAYNQKQVRDLLRAEIQLSTVTSVNNMLFYYDGTQENKVTDYMDSILTTSDVSSCAFYTKYDVSIIKSRRISLSRITSVEEVEKMVESPKTPSTDLYMALGSDVTRLEQINAASFAVNRSGTAIYFLDNYSKAEGSGNLMKMTVNKGSASLPVKIADDVFGFRFGNNSDAVYYFKNAKDGAVDIYLDGNAVAEDVYISSIYNFSDSNSLIYLADYSTEFGSGTLYLLKNGTTEKLSNDVAMFVAADPDHIAYLSDYDLSKKTGELNLYYGNGEPIKVGSDVSAIIWNSDMIDFSVNYGLS